MPSSCTRPSLMTAIRSAMRTVENRWLMTSPIRPSRCSRSSAKIAASASGSSDGGGLVEDPHVGVAIQQSGEGEALPLAARQVVAAVEEPSDLGVEAVRGAGTRRSRPAPIPAPAAPRRRRRTRARVGRAPRSPAPTARRSRSPGRARRSLSAARRGSTSRKSVPPRSTRPRGGVVEAQQELDEARLASAVVADQRQQLAGTDVEVEAGERRLGAAGVLEVDVLEADAVVERRRERAGLVGSRQERVDGEEREVVVEERGVLIEG